MSTHPTYPPVHLFRILAAFDQPKRKEPKLPEQLQALITALKTPDPDNDAAIRETEYDFDNEPEYIWQAYTASSSERAAIDCPVRIFFTCSWGEPTEGERGVDSLPQYLGIEFRLADGLSYSINFPTTFKDALSTPKSMYRDFWDAQPSTGVLALLNGMQKEVISETLASMEYFSDDTPEGRRCWPHFRKLLFDLAQFGGEDGIPGEHLFRVLRDWVLDNVHVALSTSQEYLGWGHGKYACPGRFFAAAVLKITLAHILLNYDLKFEDGTGRPANIFWGSSIRAPDTKVLFKARSRPA